MIPEWVIILGTLLIFAGVCIWALNEAGLF